MKKDICVFIVWVFGILGAFENPSMAAENHPDSLLISQNEILHKTKRFNFYFGGNVSSTMFPGSTLGVGVLGGINVHILAFEVNWQHWDELPNILSGTAFLNFPSRSPHVGPYILFGLGLMPHDGKYMAFGLGSEINFKSSFALRPELKLSMIYNFEAGFGWIEFKLNFLWNFGNLKK